MCSGACVCCLSRTQRCLTPSNHRGKLCCPWERNKGVIPVFETNAAFHVAWEGYVMFSDVRGQPGHCGACAEPSEMERGIYACSSILCVCMYEREVMCIYLCYVFVP